MTLVMTYYESDAERVMWEQHITGKKSCLIVHYILFLDLSDSNFGP